MRDVWGVSFTGGWVAVRVITAATACFAALHEPFENGSGAITRFEEIARSPHWLACRIGGPDQPVDDRAYLRFDHERTPIEVTEPDGTSVTFTDHALVRMSKGKVEIFGDVRAIRIAIPDEQTRLYFNGRLSPATITDGIMTYTSRGG